MRTPRSTPASTPRKGARPGARSGGRPDRGAAARPAGSAYAQAASGLALPVVIERTVAGMGYELIDIERAAHGLLRITIDRIPGRIYPADGQGAGEFITVDDCEQVTRQLQYVLEVEGADYRRLEVSSPGLDRPLRTPAHYARFAGQMVSLTLKMPFEGRKSYQGRLEARQADGEPAGMGGWRIVFMDGKAEKALDFAFDEVRELRLVPQVDFKGRRKPVPAPAAESSEGDRKE